MIKARPVYLDANEVRTLLAKKVAQCGSQLKWCAAHKVSPAYVCDVLNKKREPGQKILQVLKLEALTLYSPSK